MNITTDYFAARLSLVYNSHNFRRRSAATCVDRDASAKLKPERNIAKAVSSADVRSSDISNSVRLSTGEIYVKLSIAATIFSLAQTAPVDAESP